MRRMQLNRQASRQANRLYLRGRALLNADKRAGEAEGFQLMLRAAGLGHVSAMAWVAMCYERGRGTAINRPKAFAAHQAAAFGGDPFSAYNVGSCYGEGVGVRRDESLAVYWYSRAARRHVPEAIFSLGINLYNGYGIAPNRTMAFRHFRRAANLGYASAQFWTGRLLELGRGVKANRKAAVRWYRLAKRREPEAAKALKRLARRK